MPEQFPYPEQGWSTGRMRKKGSKLGPDFEHAFRETAEKNGKMIPAQQVFERSRPDLPESASGKAIATPSDKTAGRALMRTPVGPIIAGWSFAQEHKAQLQEAANSLASGDISMGIFKKLQKKLGWTGELPTLFDPTGKQHEIMPLKEAEAK